MDKMILLGTSFASMIFLYSSYSRNRFNPSQMYNVHQAELSVEWNLCLGDIQTGISIQIEQHSNAKTLNGMITVG